MKAILKIGLVASALALSAGTASAEVYNLCAAAGTKALPDGSTVPVWGYALNDPTTGCGAIEIPGPPLVVTDGILTINLQNNLTEPTSVVIPGLPMPASTGTGPTWNDGSAGPRTSATQRVRSFGAEAAAAGGTESYTWAGVRPGSFIYHSGTHPQKQVYMGLYGAATRDSAAGEAYPAIGVSPAVSYDNEVVLFYSEIDPDLNASIDDGSYGTSIHYHPRWFLVNGEPYVAGMADIDTGTGGPLAAGERVLLRLFSAAGETHVPVLQGLTMTIHAEDGLQYNYQDGATVVAAAPREQYSVMLPPLKTKDAIVQATVAGRYAVYDGNGYMTNPSDPDNFTVGDEVGGMLRFLSFGDGVDTDGDGVLDGFDNCPNDANPGQEDADGDGIGDACEADTDGDGVIDDLDNCPDVSNPDQADKDNNGVGDACEPPQVTGIWTNVDVVAGQTLSLFIFGDYFDLAPGANQVFINGIQQFLVSAVTTEMLVVRVTVTPDMIGGPVTVTTSNGSADSPTTFGDPAVGVSITSIWPGTASAGDFVFVFGSGFVQPVSASIGATPVFLVQVVSEEMLIMMVPFGATTAPVTVTTASGSATSPADLVIVP